MDIGMLWYDDDAKRKFDEKVARAVEFYRSKYGVQPTECYVHPGMLAADQPSMAAGVRLRPNRTIIKNHFWLGVEAALTTSAPLSAPAARPTIVAKTTAAALSNAASPAAPRPQPATLPRRAQPKQKTAAAAPAKRKAGRTGAAAPGRPARAKPSTGRARS